MTIERADYVVLGFSLAGVASALTLADFAERVVLLDYERDTDQIGELPRIQATSLGPSLSGVTFEEEICLRLARAGVRRITAAHVTSIYSDRSAIVECGDSQWLCTGIVFAPNGTEPGIEIEGATDLFGFGVSYSASADGPFYEKRRVAVYGDSPRVIEHAAVAAQYASEVAVLIKDKADEGDPEILRSLRALPVRFEYPVHLQRVRSSTGRTLTSVEIETAGTKRSIDVSALFVAQHLQPVIDVVRGTAGSIVFAGLSTGVAYWKHAALVDDGVRAARTLLSRQQSENL